jgi:hypothetical protein
MKKSLFIAVILLLVKIPIYSKKLNQASGNIGTNQSTFIVKTGNTTISEAIEDVKNCVVIIKNGGGLSFNTGADITFGEPLLDGSNNLIYDTEGLPKMKSRMMIVEENGSFARGVDNFNNWNCRFRGTANVKFYGVDYYQQLTNRSDFDVGGTGNVEFHNCRLIVNTSSEAQYNHLFSNQNIIINGLTIDHRRAGASCEMSVRPINPIKNLELIDNNPGSNSRHFVILPGASHATIPLEIFQLKARNISLYSWAGNRVCHLINSRGEIYKSIEGNAILKGFRDFTISVINSDTKTPASGSKFFIKRSGGSEAYTDFITLNSNGEANVRLLQFIQPNGSNTNTYQDNSNYNWAVVDYNRQIISGSHQVQFTNSDGQNNVNNQLLFPDNNITETNESTVSGYSTINNLEELYDYAKYWKIQQSNIETPSLSELLINVNGGTIELANQWNLVLNKNAGSVFSVDKLNKIITIKSTNLEATSKYTRLISTTGTISVVNDEYINFPYTDKDRDSYVRIINVNPTDNIKVMDGTVEMFNRNGEFGFPYKSENKLYGIVLLTSEQVEAMKYYDLNNSGIDNKMSISFTTANNSFTQDDRTKLYETSEKTTEKIENNKALLKTIKDWLIMMTKKIQDTP